MKANQVYTALESISQGNARQLDRDTTKFLHDRGLVAVLSSSEYHDRQHDANRLGSVSKDADDYQEQVAGYQVERDRLSGKLGSKWHRFWSFQTTLDREQRELRDSESRLRNSSEKLSASQAEKQRLKELKADLEGYVQTSPGYVAFTPEGSQRRNELAVRDYRLGEHDYGEAEAEIEQINRAIEEGSARFKSHYDEASSEGFSTGRKLRTAMALLAKRKGTVEENVAAFQELFRILGEKGHNWNSSDSYGVVASVSTEDKPVGDLAELLDSTYVRLGEMQIPTGGATRNLSARFIRGQTAQSVGQRLERFKEVYNIYRERYSSGEVNRMVCASLMNVEGEPNSVLDAFTETYERISKTFSSGERLRLATASLLLGKRAGIDAEARFGEAYQKFRERGRSGSGYYPLLAGFTLMPGSMNEIFEIFDKTHQRIRELNISGEEAMFIASNLMGSVYQSWSDSGLFEQTGLSRSTYDSSTEDSSSCFNLGWAVTGDLIDNGSLDLSGGFIAGGLLGGLLDD